MSVRSYKHPISFFWWFFIYLYLTYYRLIFDVLSTVFFFKFIIKKKVKNTRNNTITQYIVLWWWPDIFMSLAVVNEQEKWQYNNMLCSMSFTVLRSGWWWHDIRYSCHSHHSRSLSLSLPVFSAFFGLVLMCLYSSLLPIKWPRESSSEVTYMLVGWIDSAWEDGLIEGVGGRVDRVGW